MVTIAQALFEEGFEEGYGKPPDKATVLRSFLINKRLNSCYLSPIQIDLINKADSDQLQLWINRASECRCVYDVFGVE